MNVQLDQLAKKESVTYPPTQTTMDEAGIQLRIGSNSQEGLKSKGFRPLRALYGRR